MTVPEGGPSPARSGKGAGPREAARSRLETLSILGGAGSIAISGLVAGAAAEAYAARFTPTPSPAVSSPAPAAPPPRGTLTEEQLLAVQFSLPLPPPPQPHSARHGGTVASRPAAGPGRVAPAAVTAGGFAPAPVPRPGPAPAKPAPPATTGQS